MTIELDHYFVFAAHGAPEAQLLVDIGLVEGLANDHPGQGTANRRFFFRNSALELIYIRDADEAANGPGSGLRLPERAGNPDASPFGLIVRGSDDRHTPPFPGWRYCPDYFSAEQCFHVGENSSCIGEPLCVYLPPNLPEADPAVRQANPDWRVTGLRLAVPIAEPSATLAAVAACPGLEMQFGSPNCLEIEFNAGQRGRLEDLSPELPILVRW